MAKLSGATEYALNIVAHALMARGMAKNVKGMDDFYDYWLSLQVAKDREIVEAYIKLATQATKDFSAMLDKDMEKANG